MSHSPKRILWSIIIGFFAEIINKLSPLIIVSYAQSRLGLVAFGQIEYSILFVDLFIPLITWGYATNGTMNIGKLKDNKDQASSLIRHLLLLKILHFFFSLLILWGILTWGSGYETYSYNIMWLSLILFTTAIDTIFVLEGIQKRYLLSAFTIIVKLISIAGVLLLVNGPEDGVYYGLLTFGTQGIISLFSLVVISRRYNLFPSLPKLSVLSQQFKNSIPYGIAMAGYGFFEKMDRLFVEKYFTAEFVGQYLGYYKIYQGAVPLVFIIGAVYFSESVAKKDKSQLSELFYQSSLSVLSILLPVVAGLFFVYEDIIHLIFDKQFIENAITLPILVCGLIPFCFIMLGSYQVLFINQRVNYFNLTLVTSILLSIAIYYITIQELSIVTMSTAVLGCKLILALLVMWGCRNFLERIPLKEFVRVICPSMIMTIGLLLLSIKSFYITIIAGALIYTLFYYLLNKERSHQLLKLFRKS